MAHEAPYRRAGCGGGVVGTTPSISAPFAASSVTRCLCQRAALGVEQSHPSQPGLQTQQPVELSHLESPEQAGHAAVAHATPCHGGLHTHCPVVVSHEPRGEVHSATHVRCMQPGPYQGFWHVHLRVS